MTMYQKSIENTLQNIIENNKKNITFYSFNNIKHNIEDFKIIHIFQSIFKIYPCGKIERQLKSGKWKIIENKANHKQGYNVIMIEKKQYTRSRIIAHAYFNFELNDNLLQICFKDLNRLNTSIYNLIICDRSTSSLFNLSACGWIYNTHKCKYISTITFMGNTINLEEFDNHDDANKCYIKYKQYILNNICNLNYA